MSNSNANLMNSTSRKLVISPSMGAGAQSQSNANITVPSAISAEKKQESITERSAKILKPVAGLSSTSNMMDPVVEDRHDSKLSNVGRSNDPSKMQAMSIGIGEIDRNQNATEQSGTINKTMGYNKRRSSMTLSNGQAPLTPTVRINSDEKSMKSYEGTAMGTSSEAIKKTIEDKMLNFLTEKVDVIGSKLTE